MSTKNIERICEYLNKMLNIDAHKCLQSKGFLRFVDFSKCFSCETCVYVCEFIHDGKSYVRLRKTDMGVEIPIACFHCFNAHCMSVCKREAIIRGSNGEVLIIQSKCNNCMECFYSCPFKAIRIIGNKIVNCDLCKQLREQGLPPACISMCPSKAVELMQT